MPAHMEFEFDIGAAAKRQPDQPFNLLVLGDFSGRRGASGESIATRKVMHIDLDNIDRLWSELSPSVGLQIGSSSIEFSPRDIDDFHADELFRTLPAFERLRDLRKRLLNQDTASSALDEIMSSATVVESDAAAEQTQAAELETGEHGGDMFERLLGKPAGQQPSQQKAKPVAQSLDAFIHEMVAPYIVQLQDPRVETAVDSVDLAIAELMRRILHHEDFQSLECNWRALFDMVHTLELDEDLHLYVCDIRGEELLGALPDPGSSLQDSALFQLLVERRRQATDDTPYSVIAGSFYFGPGPEDIALLNALGAAAVMNNATFLGAAKPAMLGCSSTADLANVRYWASDGDDLALWQTLQSSSVAPHIGLVLPRLLARLPYGEKAEEIDSFQFEEMPLRNHEDYLWANPAMACSGLLAESFTRQGWRMTPGDDVGLGDLPAHHYKEDGESRLQPCAELLISEATMVAMLEQGLMPLISYRNQNTAVVGRFQSIASPATALDGPWS